jgi:uncharacterized protein (TIGR03790 family)
MLRSVLIILLCVFGPELGAEINPQSTVVLANENVPDGILIAKALMRKRGIPEKNLISLPMPTDEEISWQQFSDDILNPLRRELLQAHFIEGHINSEPDARGRIDFIPTGEPRLTWLITVYGVPLKIRPSEIRKSTSTSYGDKARINDNELELIGSVNYGDQSSVDSELALVALVNLDANGARKNPWFGQDTKLEEDEVGIVRTARIDGPSTSDALRAMMGAWRAEAQGLRGRSYVDLGGPYADGNEWFERVAGLTQGMGFPTDKETSSRLFNEHARSDAPAFYLGWYSQIPNGRFALPRAKLAPGAIALHLHSFSATSLRRSSIDWAPWLIRQGAGFTSGNVYEPYLGFTMRPDLLVKGLAMHMTTGEAAWYATPVVSWQGTILGDPFYQPFNHDIKLQLQDFIDKPDELGVYAVLRASQLMLVRDLARTEELLQSSMKKTPSLVLAYAIAKIQADQGKSFAWDISNLPDIATTDDGLIWEISQFLTKNGKKQASEKLLRTLLLRPECQDDPELKKVLGN